MGLKLPLKAKIDLLRLPVDRKDAHLYPFALAETAKVPAAQL